MKIKKMFLLLSFLNLLSFVCKSNEEILSDQAINTLEKEIKDETPLQFATKSLHSHFSSGNFTDQTINFSVAKSKPDVFSKSFLKYIKDVYNKPYYSEILSQDGTHIIEFFKLCNELDLGINSAYVGMRLFRIKMMSCAIIDDTVVSQILEELPALVAKYFERSNNDNLSEDVLSKSIENIILGHLDDQFLATNNSLDKVRRGINKDISKFVFNELKKIKDKEIDKKNKMRLRFEVIRFFETALSRVLWNPKTPETIWPSFLSIANGLQKLAAIGVVNHMDDLDALLWELVHRLNFFLDLSGFCLPLNIYEEIETALEEKSVFFLESQEQDEGIKSKKEELAERLLYAKTKALAFHKKGIMP